MAMKKRTGKKAGIGKKAGTAKKTAAKPKKPTGRIAAGIRSSKKLVDQVLVKVSPQLQSKVDHLMKTLESTREGRMGDLTLLAGKILIRAQDVSRSLRQIKKKPPAKK